MHHETNGIRRKCAGCLPQAGDKECQDSFKKLEYDDGTVIKSIADGHGSKAIPYSKSGSSNEDNVF